MSDEAAVVRVSSAGHEPVSKRVRVRAAVRRPDAWLQLLQFALVGAQRLRREPRGLHARRPRRGHALPGGRDPRLPRRGLEQLPLEPALDVQGRRRPRASSGRALPASSASSRSPPGSCSSRCWSRSSGMQEVPAQAIAIVAVDAAELPRQQALELLALIRGRSSRRSSSRSSPRRARTRRRTPATHGGGLAGATPITAPPRRGRSRRPRRARRARRVAEDRRRAAPASEARTVTSLRKDGRWVVQAFTARQATAGRSSRSTSTRTAGAVTEAWTGPQVAWGMARGYPGRVRPDGELALDLDHALRALRRPVPRRAPARCACCTSTC